MIEINDLQITVHDNEYSLAHCAYAHVEKECVTFGDKALSNIKICPDDFYSHYWQRLGYERINSHNKHVRHFADLVYLQLTELTQQYKDNTQVVFVVPSYYKEQQLALLLGLATSCKLLTLAIINHDVINIVPVEFQGEYCVAQLGLHNSNVSRLTINKSIQLNDNKTFPESGFLELVSYILNWCNQVFIKHLRFDPLHSAHTEQALFDQIYKMLCQLANTGEITEQTILINEKAIKIEKRYLINKITDFFAVLFEISPPYQPLYLTTKLYNLISITHYQHECNRLPIAPMVNLIKEYLPFINKQTGICLLDKIPRLKEYKKNNEKSTRIPTHILCNQLCVAFKKTRIYVNETQNGVYPLSRKQTKSSVIALIPNEKSLTLTFLKETSIAVNKSHISQATLLNCGDTISNVDNLELKLIFVDEEF